MRPPPGITTPEQLGDGLARLVWENFGDALSYVRALYDASRGEDGDEAPEMVAEELLILLLWAHTRACQQAFSGRSDPELLKATLDAMHRAVFEDLEAHGTPREQLPLIEQRISARYSEYYQAADGGVGTVGEVAARWVGGTSRANPRLSALLTETAVAAAGPLRDFLDDIVLAG